MWFKFRQAIKDNNPLMIVGAINAYLECHKCGAEMQLNTGKFGKYFLCLNDNCKTTRNLQRNGEPKPIVMEPILSELACEKFEDHYLLRDSMKGLFLAASKYPKNRETRAPSVEEFNKVKQEQMTKAKQEKKI